MGIHVKTKWMLFINRNYRESSMNYQKLLLPFAFIWMIADNHNTTIKRKQI